MKLNISVVCGDKGWVYSNFIDRLRMHSRYNILLNSTAGADLIHFLPYYEWSAGYKVPSSAWFSHQESKAPLQNKFIQVAQQVNIAISHSKKYADLLRVQGINTVKQILPGIDLLKYTIKPANNQSDKLVLGWVGRNYQSSNRKNMDLLSKIKQLPGVELKTTNGKVAEAEMPHFYNATDLIISPSVVEGGPMAHLEALACGKNFLCYEGVGTAGEFERGTLTVPYNNESAFLKKIAEIRSQKLYHTWRGTQFREGLRQQVEQYTWEKFGAEHDKTWEELLG